ncbi:hypothetical protein CKAH01_05940 [Colletotrichum kahawae]|uniref:Uncharacterized protein n=1 Tax=Colletotrichum kahawae TaxID=34407 RepID=A0AAD9YBS0_COLKA|nr:hypothetical protein CKAH01_05940 [Colletotrichum kahawae]
MARPSPVHPTSLYCAAGEPGTDEERRVRFVSCHLDTTRSRIALRVSRPEAKHDAAQVGSHQRPFSRAVRPVGCPKLLSDATFETLAGKHVPPRMPPRHLPSIKRSAPAGILGIATGIVALFQSIGEMNPRPLPPEVPRACAPLASAALLLDLHLDFPLRIAPTRFFFLLPILRSNRQPLRIYRQNTIRSAHSPGPLLIAHSVAFDRSLEVLDSCAGLAWAVFPVARPHFRQPRRPTCPSGSQRTPGPGAGKAELWAYGRYSWDVALGCYPPIAPVHLAMWVRCMSLCLTCLISYIRTTPSASPAPRRV